MVKIGRFVAFLLCDVDTLITTPATDMMTTIKTIAFVECGALHAALQIDEMYLEGVEARRARLLALAEQQQTATDVAAQMFEVRGYGVCETAKVQAMRKPGPDLVAVLLVDDSFPSCALLFVA